MRLSVSNIGWPHDYEDVVLKHLAETSFSAIEIAPSRIWTDFRQINADDRKKYLSFVRSFGLSICSMHSLYFGMNGMNMFGNNNEVRRFTEFTKELIRLASDLEIPRMILGSPPIRDRGNLTDNIAIERSSAVLNPLADYAYSNGTKILIEALSREETSFINTHNDALELIRSVDSKGFGLHLDAKAISAESVDYELIFEDCKGVVEHFHVNENKLSDFADPILDHNEMSKCLRKTGYDGYVSIEMRQQPDYLKSLIRALDYVENKYGNG